MIGANGQDGSYLSELLLSKGYIVFGTVRRSSTPNLERIWDIQTKLNLKWMDLADASSVQTVVARAEPDEIYNLGAMSDVGVSYDVPEYTSQVTGLGTIRVLEAMRDHAPEARFYQAGSSEMFGLNPDVPTNEDSAFHPASPYAVAKVFAHQITVNYREAYGLHASNGILMNHESERRGDNFVTQKIANGVANIFYGRQENLQLGNLDACRDWGYSRDYVEAMWLMLQAPEPDDYVIATGETHSVREFAEKAFNMIGYDWREWVVSDPEYHRPLDPSVLLGDATKARKVLGWEPTVGFDELVERMVTHALERFRPLP